MKKTLSSKLLLILILLASNGVYADDIWTQNFSDNLNKGYWGGGSDMLEVVDWTLDVTNCDLADDADYVKVVETSGGRLEAVDCDGEAVWESKSIDISNFTNCAISIITAETGTSTNDEKYIKCFYKLDGGSEIAFDSNAENIGNWDNSEAQVSGLNASSLVIVVRLNNPLSSNKVYFDDIVVSGDPVVIEADRLTKITIADNPISSQLIDSKIDTAEEAISCFLFDIDETNLATDGMATKISRMTFFNSNPENSLNWANSLGGVLLFANENQIIPENVRISSDSIVLDFTNGQIEIPEGEKLNFDLRCFLNSQNPLDDGKNIAFKIAEGAKGFQSFNDGSAFSETNAEVLSAIHSIDVNASELAFSDVSDNIKRNQYFSISVLAVDEFKNIDKDETREVTLSLHSGDNELFSDSGFNKLFVEGKSVFDSLYYQIVDTIKLISKSEGFPDLISDEIVIYNTFNSDVLSVNWNPSDTLFSSLKVTELDRKEVFRFSVLDGGEDGVSTLLKEIRIHESENNQLDWDKAIGEFFIYRDNVELDANLSVENNFLQIEFAETENGREIQSENLAEFSIYCYLKEGETADGEIFQMEIDKSGEFWEIDSQGSGLKPEFTDNIIGPEFICEVKGSEMKFREIPKSVNFQKEFIVEIELLDEFGNIDENSSIQIELSLASGTGELLSSEGLVRNSEEGKFTWNDLVYNKAENFTIQAESDSLKTILSDNISGVDSNSTIEFTSEINQTLLNPLSCNQESAIPVLNFKIKDSGEYDNLATLITSLKFYKDETNDSFNWKKHIAGALIKSGGELIASTTDIEEDYIRFNSSKGVVEIVNATEKDFQLGIYFRKSQLPDNKTFKLKIPKENYDWKTGTNSSKLADVLNENIISETFTLNVKLSKLSFISAPYNVLDSSEFFSLKIAACDENQNIDKDATLPFDIEFINGAGELKYSETKPNIENGFAEINSLKYIGTQNFSLVLKSEYLSDTCQIFLGEDEINVNHNFETSNLDNWQNTSDWAISTYEPINDNYSLKHNLTNQSGSSFITGKMLNYKPEIGTLQWTFIIRNGDWDPSSGNSFAFHLFMDNYDPNKADIKYSVGVNLSGSNDLLSLWKTEQNKAEQLIVSGFNWNEFEDVAVQVRYEANGKWTLNYNRLGDTSNWFSAGKVMSIINADIKDWFYALQFNFETASRAGELWFDDLKIESGNTAPFIKSYEIMGRDSILISFSEDIDIDKSLLSENFKVSINDIVFNDYSIIAGENESQVLLLMNSVLLTGNYFIEIFNITDKNGAINKKDTIAFEYLAPAQTYDVLINEIMADENPTKGLPEYEYIELYNTRDYPVSVENWLLKVGAKEVNLSADTLAANSYLILCSTSAAEFFADYGNVLGVSGFPGLTNSGAEIEILSPTAEQIDKIAYSDSWYKSAEKEDGGWSLERIDPMNTCSTYGNWSASVNEKGGTPGSLNSIYSENIDTTLPLVSQFKQLSANKISIDFSEYMDTLSLKEISNYTLENNAINNLELLSANKLELSFENIFTDGEIQELSVSNLQDECGNVLDTVLSFIRYEIHENDVVINEIMADENPTKGLPEYEYIELYNTRDYPVSVENWLLKVGAKEVNLSADTLAVNSYLILCSTSAAEFFADYGNVLGVSGFSGLTNSGAEIEILSPTGEQIDKIAYSDSWYKSAEKEDGGWSLERIDPMNTAWQEPNWSASEDLTGGTPGKVNSVYAENRDLNNPEIVKLEVKSANSLAVFFSEPMLEEEMLNLKNIELLPDLEYPEKVINIDGKGVEYDLMFGNELLGNSQYELIFSDLITDLAGNSLLEQKVEFSVPVDISKGDVVINEVLFNPLSGGSDYVELYNVSDNILDLSNLYLAKRDENLILTDSTKLSDEQLLFQPNSFILISSDTTNVIENYFTNNPEVFYEIKIPNYSDKEGRVVLLSDLEVIDDFAYKEKMHFDLLASVDGVALERINPNADTNSESNWQSAAQNVGFGTPGLENSVYNNFENQESEVSLSTKIFTPDNDGKDDRLYINFKLKEDGFVVNIRIYNSIGKELRKLASNLYLSSEDKVYWDGLNAKKERLPIGIYMVYIELFNTDGERKVFKKTCVLGGRFK
nr:lamin tail domain-containing protein [uncultured Marinifilum sp.]